MDAGPSQAAEASLLHRAEQSLASSLSPGVGGLPENKYNVTLQQHAGDSSLAAKTAGSLQTDRLVPAAADSLQSDLLVPAAADSLHDELSTLRSGRLNETGQQVRDLASF